jgi:hypothetical protein
MPCIEHKSKCTITCPSSSISLCIFAILYAFHLQFIYIYPDLLRKFASQVPHCNSGTGTFKKVCIPVFFEIRVNPLSPYFLNPLSPYFLKRFAF